jgi:hypothetical protein
LLRNKTHGFAAILGDFDPVKGPIFRGSLTFWVLFGTLGGKRGELRKAPAGGPILFIKKVIIIY